MEIGRMVNVTFYEDEQQKQEDAQAQQQQQEPVIEDWSNEVEPVDFDEKPITLIQTMMMIKIIIMIKIGRRYT